MRYVMILLSALIIGQAAVGAAVYKSSNYYRLAESDTLNGDLFFGGRDVVLDGLVNRDAIIGAGTVTVSGRIADDLYAWANRVDVRGDVGDTFLGFAKKVEISGVVHGDVIAYAGQVTILPGARIEGDLYVGTGLLILDQATVSGDIRGGAHEMELNGVCRGKVDLSGSNVTFGEQFDSPNPVTITLREKPEQPLENAPGNLVLKIKPGKHFYQKGWFYYFLFAAFVIGVLLIGIFPGFFDNLVSLGRERWSVNLLSGLGFFIVVPIVSIILLIILPLGLLSFFTYFSIVYLSKIFASFIIGYFLLRSVQADGQVNRYLAFLTGLVLLTLVYQIPSVGGILYLVALLLGAGTFVHYLFLVKKNGKSVYA